MQYKVAANEKPTFFNKDALLGGLIGMLAIPAVAAVAITVPHLFIFAALGSPALGAAIGTAIGSIVGRVRMKHELEEGKVVKEPSMLNKKTAIGSLIGFVAGAEVGFFTAVAFGAVATVGGAIAGTALAALAAGAVIGTVAGALIGGKSGKDDMQREYVAAAGAQAQQDRLVSIARSKQLEQAANYTPLPDNSPAQTLLAAGAGAKLMAAAPTMIENNPTNNTTVINGADSAPLPAQPETHTHNITTNTMVITATPPQNAAEQPAPQWPQAEQQPKADTGKHAVLHIAITGTPPQQLAQQDGNAETQPDGKFTSAILAKRQQQPITVTVQADKGPGKSYTSTIATEREQPTVLTNQV